MYLNKTESVDNWLKNQLGIDNSDNLRKLLNVSSNKRDQLNVLATASGFTCPAINLAKGVAATREQSWVYYFTRQRDGEMAESMGAYHGAELPYVFDTHDDWLPTSQIDRRLTKTMKNYWTNFAKTANPNGLYLPNWPRFINKLQWQGGCSLQIVQPYVYENYNSVCFVSTPINRSSLKLFQLYCDDIEGVVIKACV